MANPTVSGVGGRRATKDMRGCNGDVNLGRFARWSNPNISRADRPKYPLKTLFATLSGFID